jgi:hypothetical protein
MPKVIYRRPHPWQIDSRRHDQRGVESLKGLMGQKAVPE